MKLPQITIRNEMRILNWGHVVQIVCVLAVIILAFVKIGTGNVRGRSDVWGLSVVSPLSHLLFYTPGSTSQLTDVFVGYQIIGLLHLHDRNRKDRKVAKMVQHQSSHDPQLCRSRLLDSSDRHQLYERQRLFRSGMYSQWIDHLFGIRTCVSPNP